LMKPFELVGWWFLPIQDNSWFKRLTTWSRQCSDSSSIFYSFQHWVQFPINQCSGCKCQSLVVLDITSRVPC
jgi:hypothetical protein